MLDHDISARDARALLSVPDTEALTPDGINRRRFLQMVGLGVGGGALLGDLAGTLLPGADRERALAAPLGPNDHILVLITLYGGNDVLNTIVPYSNPRYAEYRANIGIPTDELHLLDGTYGLHPSLTYVKSLWDQQQVAIVHGLGYDDQDFSHFNSMAFWMSGFPHAAQTSGWLGRWLDQLGTADLYTAATLGHSIPLHMVGPTKRGTAIPPWGFRFGGATDGGSKRMYDAMRQFSAVPAGRGPWHDSVARSERTLLDVAASVGGVYQPPINELGFGLSMRVAARLINANFGFRVIEVSLDGFDHHSSELGSHADLLQQLDDGIKAFHGVLDPARRSQVTLMTYSEFGRTPWDNDSQGTDHGAAGTHFVIGPRVLGGFYGEPSPLTTPGGGALGRWDQLQHTMDFRSLYATMIDGVLGGDAAAILQGNYPTIPLFRSVPNDPGDPGDPGGNPGGGGGGGCGCVLTGGEFVGIVPTRLLDTRGARGALGQATSLTLPVAGTHGIPAGAVGAVLNVTAVDATAASYVTVWPTGIERPNTSSLNTLGGGDTVPNLVITKLGANGSVDIYNNAGDTHIVVDIVGYFVESAAARFTGLPPARILDTRMHPGPQNFGPTAALGPGHSFDLTVTGHLDGHVPDDAEAVVMNVTVTEPTGAGFITVWPTGAAMPTASNLNFVPGQTAPNLVIVKLGTGGKVSFYNSGGESHLVADVLGYFSATSTARLTPLPPSRLLDTRSDNGAPAPVAQVPITLPVLNRGGVPAAGVSAVVLNVTATEPTVDGYVTVYPAGQQVPVASNLNTRAGETRANLVIAKVGTDGAVQLYNSGGTVHLIADVVGWFSA